MTQVNTDEDPELKELFSVDTFPRIMLWSKRLNKLFTFDVMNCNWNNRLD